jgi:hypothetical protein
MVRFFDIKDEKELIGTDFLRDEKKRTNLLIENAKNGGNIPEGFLVYRGDTRTIEELKEGNDKKISGFAPDIKGKTEEELIKLAREQASNLLSESIKPNDFVFMWKLQDGGSQGYKLSDSLIYEKLVYADDSKTRMRGVACGVECAQKQANFFEIKLPKLYAIGVNEKNAVAKIVIYGNKKTIKESTILWMNLIQGTNAEEMVSLTVIPWDNIKLL